MIKSEMIDALLKELSADSHEQDARRGRLQRMSVTALEREMLMRGLVRYDEPDPDDDDEVGVAEWPDAIIGLSAGPAEDD